MTTQDHVSVPLAKKLKERGYGKYAGTQFIWSSENNKYEELHKDLEWCAMAELAKGVKLIYAPSLDEAYRWLLEKDPSWNVSVLWDNKLKGYHFIVQNIKTGYEYVQPTAPGEMNVFRMYEWGIEHAINRIEQ